MWGTFSKQRARFSADLPLHLPLPHGRGSDRLLTDWKVGLTNWKVGLTN